MSADEDFERVFNAAAAEDSSSDGDETYKVSASAASSDGEDVDKDEEEEEVVDTDDDEEAVNTDDDDEAAANTDDGDDNDEAAKAAKKKKKLLEILKKKKDKGKKKKSPATVDEEPMDDGIEHLPGVKYKTKVENVQVHLARGKSTVNGTLHIMKPGLPCDDNPNRTRAHLTIAVLRTKPATHDAHETRVALFVNTNGKTDPSKYTWTECDPDVEIDLATKYLDTMHNKKFQPKNIISAIQTCQKHTKTKIDTQAKLWGKCATFQTDRPYEVVILSQHAAQFLKKKLDRETAQKEMEKVERQKAKDAKAAKKAKIAAEKAAKVKADAEAKLAEAQKLQAKAKELQPQATAAAAPPPAPPPAAETTGAAASSTGASVASDSTTANGKRPIDALLEELPASKRTCPLPPPMSDQNIQVVFNFYNLDQAVYQLERLRAAGVGQST